MMSTRIVFVGKWMKSVLGGAAFVILAGCAAETGSGQLENLSNTSRSSQSVSKSCTNGLCTTTITTQLAEPLADDEAYRSECVRRFSGLSTSIRSLTTGGSDDEDEAGAQCVDESSESGGTRRLPSFSSPQVTINKRACVFQLPATAEGVAQDPVKIELEESGGAAVAGAPEYPEACTRDGVQCLTEKASDSSSVKVTVVAKNTPQQVILQPSDYIAICSALAYPAAFTFDFTCVKKDTCKTQETEFAKGQIRL